MSGAKLSQPEIKILLPCSNEVQVCFNQEQPVSAVFDSGAEISVVDPSCLTSADISQNECGNIQIRSVLGEKLWVKTANIPCRLFSAHVDCPMTMIHCAVTPRLTGGKCLISLQDYIQLQTQRESYELTLGLSEVRQANLEQSDYPNDTDRLCNNGGFDVCMSVPLGSNDVQTDDGLTRSAAHVSVVT